MGEKYEAPVLEVLDTGEDIIVTSGEKEDPGVPDTNNTPVPYTITLA